MTQKIRCSALFSRTDVDGADVSETDDQLILQVSTAQSRVRLITKTLSKDLDANGDVTKDELQAYFAKEARKPVKSSGVLVVPTEEQVEEITRELVEKALEADRDRNGVITFVEALNTAIQQMAGNVSKASHQTIPLELDADGDGTVSQFEFDQLIEIVLFDVDTNGDGVISELELSAFKQQTRALDQKRRAELAQRRRDAVARQQAKTCGFPGPAADAKILLVGVNSGQALGTVSFDDGDVAPTVADVWIEPGHQPLYLLLVSQSAMIWRFSGAVERISSAVASAHHHDADKVPRVALVGLPSKRVFIPASHDCLKPFYDTKSEKGKQARNQVSLLLGRPVDLVLAQSKVSGVSLPSGLFDLTIAYSDIVTPSKSDYGEALWENLLRRYPGGVVQIRSKAIISLSPVEANSTLPMEAGLAQLVDTGALQVIGTSRVVMLNGIRFILGEGHTVVLGDDDMPDVSMLPSKFKIVKSVHLPPGLNSGHSARFLLAPGIEKPDNLPEELMITE